MQEQENRYRIRRIVVIDDDDESRRLLTDFLTLEGYQVREASDGMIGIDMLREEAADLVITDLNMPALSGLDVLDIVRQQHPGTQVIVVTGFGTMETVLEALHRGAVDYLVKPFLLEILKASMKKAEANRQVQHELTRYRDTLSGLQDQPEPVDPLAAYRITVDPDGQLLHCSRLLKDWFPDHQELIQDSLTPEGLEPNDWQPEDLPAGQLCNVRGHDGRTGALLLHPDTGDENLILSLLPYPVHYGHHREQRHYLLTDSGDVIWSSLNPAGSTSETVFDILPDHTHREVGSFLNAQQSSNAPRLLVGKMKRDIIYQLRSIHTESQSLAIHLEIMTDMLSDSDHNDSPETDRMALLIDNGYIVRQVEVSLLRFLKTSSIQVIGRSLSTVLGESVQPIMKSPPAKHYETDYMIRLNLDDQKVHFIELKFEPARTRETHYCILEDVTHRKKLEDQLVRQKNQLESTQRKLSMILNITTELQEVDDITDRLQLITDTIIGSQTFNRAVMVLLDARSGPDNLQYRAMASSGIRPSEAEKLLTRLALDHLTALENTAPVLGLRCWIINNEGVPVPAADEWQKEHHLVLPVHVHGNRLSGYLLLDQPVSGFVPTSTTVDVFEVFVSQMGSLLEEFELEQQVQDSEVHYRNLFDNARYPIILSDINNGRILDANRETSRLFGYAREELMRLNVWELRPEDYQDDARENHQEAIRSGAGSFRNIPIRRKDGSLVYVEYDAIVTEFKGRAVLLSFYRDITEKRQLEFSLIQSQKLAGLGQLSAGIAHELRNPLGIINSSIYFLRSTIEKNDIQLADNFHKHLGIISSEVDRSRKIIENLLNFSRISKVDLEWTDVNQLLQDTLDLVRKELLVNDIELVTDLEETPRVSINLDQMKQAFLNIILNATQAMPEGGTLTIRTKRWENALRIDFNDTGVGIPEEELNDVLNPFFTTKEPGVGTGLGLSITHSIIRKSRGRLLIASEVSVGTTVTIELPLE